MSDSGQPPKNRPPPPRGPPSLPRAPAAPAHTAPPRMTPVIPPVAPLAPQGVPAPSAARPGPSARPATPPAVPPPSGQRFGPSTVPAMPSVAPVRPPTIPALAPTAARPTSASIARPPGPGSTAPIAPFLTPLVPNIAPVSQAAAAPGDPTQQSPLDEAQLAELSRLTGALDRLDYFELLGVERAAAPAEIKRAFYKNSRTWHPDRFYQVRDEALKERVHDVYKRVTEAYAVLRDDVKRPQYLADVTGPERAQKLRYTEAREAEARVQKKKEQEEQIGTTPKGRQLYATAAADLEAGRFGAAERNVKMALTFEPQNARYREKLKEAQDKLLEESRKSGSQFKIK